MEYANLHGTARAGPHPVPDLAFLRSDPFEDIVEPLDIECCYAKSLRSKRVNDYAAMGVEHIWAVDPIGRVGYYASRRGFQQPEDGVLRIAGTPIVISLAEVFAELDEA